MDENVNPARTSLSHTGLLKLNSIVWDCNKWCFYCILCFISDWGEYPLVKKTCNQKRHCFTYFFMSGDVVSVQQPVIQVHLTAAHISPSMWSVWAPPWITDSGLHLAPRHIQVVFQNIVSCLPRQPRRSIPKIGCLDIQLVSRIY